MHVLVTGGCGYIGSELVPLLLEKGYDVTILDNFSMSSPSILFNLRKDVNFIFGDIRNEEDVKSALKGCDAVVHLAALTGADESFKAKERTFDINLRGTENLLKLAADEEVERFVFSSSCNIYGRQEGVISEESKPNPLNPYAESKRLAEEACLKYQRERGLSTSILRLSTLYGYAPGVRFNLVINMFALYALTNHPLTIYGDGTNWRPYIHVKDAAKAFLFALERRDFEKEVFNVGSNRENYRIKDIVALFKEAFKKNLGVVYLRDKDSGPSYRVDFSKIERAGFSCERSVKDGIKELIEKFIRIKVKRK